MTFEGKLYELESKELFEQIVPEHAEWLNINEISYTVMAFFWPSILSIAGRSINKEVVEFELSIEDEKEAMMFRIFSGMTADI